MGRALFALVVFAVTAGCGPSAEPPIAPPPPPVEPSSEPAVLPTPPPIVTPPPAETALDGDVEWRLAASATTLTMGERAAFDLRTLATNRGTGPIDVLDSGFASFTVNGEPSMTLAMAFGNGIAPTAWEALAPGETADPTRSGFGEEIFPAPGEYEIVMTHGNAVVGITIEVTGEADAEGDVEDGTDTPIAGTSARDGDVEWQLRTSATTLTMAERDAWVLRVVATNRSSAPLDYVAVSSFTFSVDGESSMALNMAFGNGGFPSSWRALAPGASADPSRRGVGIFEAPGNHEIVLTTAGGVAVSLTIHVVP